MKISRWRTLRSWLAIPALLLIGVTTAHCPGPTSQPELPGNPVAAVVPNEIEIQLGESVVLDGTASALGENTDGLGLSLLHLWKIDTKPVTSTILDESLIPTVPVGGTEASPAVVTLTPDMEGTFGVTLQVVDTGTGSDTGGRYSDRVFVLIRVAGSNGCPTADAGPDVLAQSGVPTSLDGSASTDPDLATGDDDSAATEVEDIDWTWRFSLVPGGSTLTDGDIFGQGSAHPTFVPDLPGTYILQLIVDDGRCESLPDYVTVQVASGNGTPVAEAGQAQLLTPCSPSQVTLDGTGSFDPEGGEVFYEWSITSKPNGSELTDALIDGRFTGTPSFNWDLPGVYTFQLQVNDGELSSSPDFVAVRAVPGTPNASPVVEAPAGNLISATASCTQNPYGPCSCNPCGARSLTVEAGGAYDPDGDAINYQWNLVSGDATLIGDSSEEVEIEFPALPVSCGGSAVNTAVLNLTVYDCRSATQQLVEVTFQCNG
jgi:hypothetical protein